MKLYMVFVFLLVTVGVYAVDLNPELYFKDYYANNPDVSSPFYQKSQEMGRLDADSLHYSGSAIIGFFNGYCFPFFSTLIITDSELGDYPQSIPLSVEPHAYINGYYSETNKDKKKTMMFSSIMGSFTAIATMFLIISAVD